MIRKDLMNFYKEDAGSKEIELNVDLLGKPSGAYNPDDDPGSETNKGDEGKPNKEEGNEGDKGDKQYTPDPAWDTLKKMLPKDKQKEFKVPEDINKENELDLLKEEFSKHVGGQEKPEPNPYLHPIARDLQKEFMEKGEKFDFKAWQNKISSVADVESVKSMSDDDLIRKEVVNKYGIASEENPDGLEEKDIEDYIKGMNKIQKKELSSQIREKALKEAEQFNPKDLTPQKIEPEKIKEELDKELNKIFEKAEKEPIEIAGVPISKALKEDRDGIVEAFTPNEDGHRPIDKMLQGDSDLLKFYFMATKGDDFFKSLLSDKELRGKMRDYIEKLDDDPDSKFSFDKTGSKEIDESMLGQPSRND
ncbi:MAG: hypothetical protein ACLFT4_00145 [Bacteroidales bacterium]